MNALIWLHAGLVFPELTWRMAFRSDARRTLFRRRCCVGVCAILSRLNGVSLCIALRTLDGNPHGLGCAEVENEKNQRKDGHWATSFSPKAGDGRSRIVWAWSVGGDRRREAYHARRLSVERIRSRLPIAGALGRVALNHKIPRFRSREVAVA